MSKLSENMRILRVMSNLSQKTFAEKIGRSQNTVSNWESGKISPDVDSVEKMCEIFDISPNELFGWQPCIKIEQYLSEKKQIEQELKVLEEKQNEILKQKEAATKRLLAYREKYQKYLNEKTN